MSSQLSGLTLFYPPQMGEDGEASSEEMIQQLHDAFGSGYLPMLLGVTSSALFTCRCVNDKTNYSNYNNSVRYHSH